MTTTRTSDQRERRRKRIRAKVSGTAERPRISVFKSNRAIDLQLIDDEAGKTLASATTRTAKGKTLVEKAMAAGKELAGKAAEKKISQAVFDRGGYIYTGVVKAAADGAREGGLTF